MSSLSIPIGILQRISEFLAELPEDQIADLAEGRARLAYVPDGAEAPAPRKSTPAKRAGRAARLHHHSRPSS